MPDLQTLLDARRKNQGFYVSHFIPPQNGTLVPKRVAGVPLIFVLIRTVAVTNGVLLDGAGIPRQNRNLFAADRMVL